MLKLKYLRESEGLSQKEMGEKLGGVKASLISKYEIGMLEPNLTILHLYADYFNVSIDFLLGETTEPRRAESIADGAKSSFIYILGDNGIGDKIEIPSDKLDRFNRLLKAGLPELFEKKN